MPPTDRGDRPPGVQKTEAERAATHTERYGVEKTPPRGTGLANPDESTRFPLLQKVKLEVAVYIDKLQKWVGGWRKDIRIQEAHTFVDGVNFNSTDETYTSDGFFCGPYREALILERHAVTSTPTDFYIEVWFSENGADWHKYMNGPFGDWRYEDGAGDLQECIHLPILAPYIRIRVVSSGCSSSAYFVVSVKALFNS